MDQIRKYIRKVLNETSILFKEASEIDSCDCCKYFDMESVKSYGGLQHPLYYIFEKDQSYQLKYISPKQYIYAIAQGFGGLSYEDAIVHVDKANIKKYAEDMKRGDKFKIGYYTEGSNYQEGRHRALALMEIGCDVMPVVVIKNLNEKEIDKIYNTFKDFSREELDAAFKKMGYHGVTDLDIRSIENYRRFK